MSKFKRAQNDAVPREVKLDKLFLGGGGEMPPRRFGEVQCRKISLLIFQTNRGAKRSGAILPHFANNVSKISAEFESFCHRRYENSPDHLV